MANIRLYQFPTKASPVPADIVYVGDSAASFDEVQCTIAQLISAYPNLSGIAGLTLNANKYIYSDSGSTLTAGSITALGITLLSDSTVATMQATLGLTSTPGASKFAGWDANSNLSANNFLAGYATTATAAATTTLTVASAYQQYFTGITTQTVVLPVTSTLALGQSFWIVNNSTGVVTVQSSGANTVKAMAAGTGLLVTCILTSGTTAASWNVNSEALDLPWSLADGGTGAALTASNGGIVYSGASALAILAGTATAGLALLSGANTTPSWSSSPPITRVITQRITASGAGTYTPTTGMVYVHIRAQAAGAGGGGAETTTAGNISAGGAGGGGEYIEAIFTAAQIGASKAYSVGAKGTGGTAGANNGNDGGNTTFNTTFIIAVGGSHGNGGASTSGAVSQFLTDPGIGGTGGSVATGTLIRQIAGGIGNVAVGQTTQSRGGKGGSSGCGGSGGATGAASAGGNAAANSGAGGGGAATQATTQAAGGDGADGFLEFIEYVSA